MAATALLLAALSLGACNTSLLARIPGDEPGDPLPVVVDEPTPLVDEGMGTPPADPPQPGVGDEPLPVVVDGPTPFESAGTGVPSVPPIPPPPAWDPTRDRKVRLEPDAPPADAGPVPVETPLEMPADEPAQPATEPAQPVTEPAQPVTDPDAPPAGPVGSPIPEPLPAAPPVDTPRAPAQPTLPPSDPWLGGTPPAEKPAAAPPPVRPSQPDAGLPPSGALPLPWDSAPPTQPTVPVQPDVPAQPPIPTEPPARKAPEPSPVPVPSQPADPWVPGAVPPGEPPAPINPPSRPAPEPWLPGAVPGATEPPVAPPPVPDPGATAPPPPRNPWVPGAVPPGEPPAAPPSEPPAAKPEANPWLPGAGGDAKPPAVPNKDPNPWLPTPGPGGAQPPTQPEPGGTPEDPWEKGGAGSEPYVGETPAARAMEQVTRLTDNPGSKDVRGYPPAIVPSVDPGMALTAGGRPAVIVFYDDGMRASDLQAAALLPVLVRYLDRVDFVAIDRSPGAPQASGASALAKMYLDHVPTTVVLDPVRKTRLYRSGALKAAELERVLAKVTTEAPPAPGTDRPLVPTPGRPGSDLPAFSDPDAPPAGPLPPLPGQPATEPVDAPRPPGIAFTPPADYSAKKHAERLRSAPGERGLPGYPSELVRSAPAERVLASGHSPVVIIFYDNSSKASDLQAADFLPVLVRRMRDADIVLIDVSTSARWSDSQKKVVRTYYNFFVPTTVVLASDRAPVRSWYKRVGARDLERAIDESLSR